MTRTDLHSRDIGVDDLDALMDVRTRSFGPLPATQRQVWQTKLQTFVDDRRAIGVFDDDRLVAGGRLLAFEQWWSGQRVPMAGVAGVVVDPAYRRRGVATQLMRELLARAAERGMPLSALYPATLPVYRRLGYEIAGARYRFSFPADTLRRLGDSATRSVRVRRAGPDDAPLLLDLVTQLRATGRESGPLGWPESEVRDWLAQEETFGYLADGGFVVYGWDGRDLEVSELVAGDEPTARALWSLVGSGASIARTVHAWVAPHDPIHLMLADEADSGTKVQRWMLRLVDAPAAISARGWPQDTQLEVPLAVSDDELPDNSGHWRLRIGDGAGRLERTAEEHGALTLSSRGLAGLYAGTPMAALRVAGLAAGGSTDVDARLDLAFTGATPYMLDYF